jgi:hypothetical protein
MIERLPDTTVDGQAAAVFESHFDLSAFMSSERMQTMLRESMKQGMSSSGMTSAQMEQTIDQMMPMLVRFYEGFDMTVTQTIGLEDKYTHQTTVTLVWPMDIGSFSGRRGQALDLNMTFKVGLNQFNDAPEISAPEDATLYPLENFMKGMN